MAGISRRGFLGGGACLLASLALGACSDGGDSSGGTGGEQAAASGEPVVLVPDGCTISTPYYVVTLPDSWEGRFYSVYTPGSWYMGGDVAMPLYGPDLSIFLDGDYCTFSVGMSKPATGYDDVAYYEGLFASELLGKAGRDDEWDIFVSAPVDMENPGGEKAGEDVKEFASYVDVRFAPGEVDDPRIMLAYLSTEEGVEWGCGDGSEAVEAMLASLRGSATWYGLSPRIDLNETIERDNVPDLRFAALTLGESSVDFKIPWRAECFPRAASHLDEGDSARYGTSVQYELREWSPVSRSFQWDDESIETESQDDGISIEVIESVDKGANWEKSTLELFQARPYAAEPFLAMRLGDAGDITFASSNDAFAESLEEQEKLVSEAQELLSRYLEQGDDQRDRMVESCGSSPAVEYAIRAYFEDYRFDRVEGCFALIRPSSDGWLGESALARIAIYDYGNGTVWCQLWERS